MGRLNRGKYGQAKYGQKHYGPTPSTEPDLQDDYRYKYRRLGRGLSGTLARRYH